MTLYNLMENKALKMLVRLRIEGSDYSFKMVIYLILGLMYKFLGEKMSRIYKIVNKDDHHFEAFVTQT